jgi:hypothetical protein
LQFSIAVGQRERKKVGRKEINKQLAYKRLTQLLVKRIGFKLKNNRIAAESYVGRLLRERDSHDPGCKYSQVHALREGKNRPQRSRNVKV